MDIRIYIGAHRTASQHLATMLGNNSELLDAQGIVYYSRPFKALRHINIAIKAIAKGGDKVDVTGELIHALTNGRTIDRLLIINPNIIGAVTRPFGKELFYPRTSGLVRQIQTLFDDHPLRLFVATRNPATFIPSCYAESMLSASFSSYSDFTADVNLQGLRWSSFLHRLQGKQAETSLTVWRFEDYPYIWRDVAQAFSGLQNGQDLQGDTTRISPSLSLRGAQLLNRYIEDYPPRTKQDFENTKLAFLEKFASSPNEIAGPNWPPEMVQTLTHNYEDDWYYIERMENVETIEPHHYS